MEGTSNKDGRIAARALQFLLVVPSRHRKEYRMKQWNHTGTPSSFELPARHVPSYSG